MRICAALTAAMILLAVGTANAATVLVTGSNRGLGYEFAKQYAERGYDVIATCRTPAEADDLKALATQHRNVTIEELDVTDQGEIDALAAKYEGTPIDILINNAGIMGSPADQAIGSLDYALFRRTMDTNVYGVMAVTSAFRENVKASDQKKVIAITSVAGSMTGPWENIGGIYFYRASKAALNNVMRAMGIDLRKDGVIFGLVAPGAADTDMLREDFGYRGKMMPASQAVSHMIDNIDAFTLENAKNPIDFDGSIIEW